MSQLTTLQEEACKDILKRFGTTREEMAQIAARYGAKTRPTSPHDTNKLYKNFCRKTPKTGTNDVSNRD